MLLKSNSTTLLKISYDLGETRGSERVRKNVKLLFLLLFYKMYFMAVNIHIKKMLKVMFCCLY